MDSKEINKMTDTAREMTEAQREAQEAAVESFTSLQRRSMDVARDGMKFMELQKDNAEAAQQWWSSGMKLMKLQQRNVDFTQRWMSNAVETMRGQAEQNARTAEVFARSARSQQESFRSLTQMWTGAYRDFFSPFVGYAEEGMKAARQATEQGIENTRQATEQGMRLVDDAAETGAQAARQSANGSQSKFLAGLDNGDYDRMKVGDITKSLDGLSEDDLKKVRAYEKRHKNRDTLVEQIDRRIKATS